MSNTNVYVDENELYNIANSLRYKLNTSDTFLPSEMGPAVENISGGGEIKLQDGSGFFTEGVRFNDINNLTPYFDNSITNMSGMFAYNPFITSVPSINTPNLTNMYGTFMQCNNLVTVPQYNTSNVTNMSQTFTFCNNLSNASIQNIINMCLNSNITDSSKKTIQLSNIESPLYLTNISPDRYSNRISELEAAGWTYGYT